MKNRFILPSVAQLVSFIAVKVDRILKEQSEINPTVHSFAIILSSKQFKQAGY
jgi:hypothetical protein